MRNLAVLTLIALSFGCDGVDGATEPDFPTIQRVTLHFVGVASSDAGPVEGAVVEYSVYPCPFIQECDRRVIADTTDGEGRYSIAAERTCASDQSLSFATDSVRSDHLSAYVETMESSACGTRGYSAIALLCTSEPQVFNFDFTACLGG